MEGGISPSDWFRGITISVVASIIGGISKLAIRKSWLMQQQHAVKNHRGREDDTSHVSANEDLLGHDTNAASSDPVAEVGGSSDEDARSNVQILATGSNRGVEDDDENKQTEERCRSFLFCCYLLRGSGMFGMSVLNPICCVLAMNYASPSILAPFAGLTVVWVILFSPLVNNEQPSSKQILACSLIIVGEVVVAVFGDHTNDEGVTVEEVKQSYKTGVIIYFIGLILYLLLMMYWINHSESNLLRKFAWGTSSGAITGVQNFLKDSLTIAKAMQGQRLPPLFYLLFLSAGVAAFIGLLILTACMKRYDTTYSAASFVGSFVVSASIMAVVHYNTFDQLEGIVSYVMYPFGIATLMVGVYLLIGESSIPCEDEDDEVEQRRRQDIINNNNDNDGDYSSENHMFDYAEVGVARGEIRL